VCNNVLKTLPQKHDLVGHLSNIYFREQSKLMVPKCLQNDKM